MLNKGFYNRAYPLLILIISGFLFINLAISADAADEFEFDIPELSLWEQERDDGGYYTIVDKEENILDKTVRKVYPGDEFIAADNKRYLIEKVEGDMAIAKLIGGDELAGITTLPLDEVLAVMSKEGKEANNIIAMYHTHSDESYVPSDGTHSIPAKGGIYKVGAQLAAKLKDKGVKVAYDETPHDPHDADAYRRSRRTAIELMKQGPAAIIDIHRDGVPDPDFYYSNVSGVDVTKVRLVVGRQNQNMNSNLDFAKNVKAQLDKIYPGLVHGIFMAKGNYNQDLSPRSMLIEVGTHTNQREMAEKGAVMFADAIPVVLGIASPQSPGKPSPIKANPGDKKSLWWLIALVIVGGGGFLLLSTGSVKQSLTKVKNFPAEEFPNIFGRGNKKPLPKEDNDE